jgi:urease accessory protein
VRRANLVIKAADLDPWKIVGRVVLDHENRYRRRLVLRMAQGESFLLDLSDATHLRHGDGLLLDDGAIVLIEALPEPLLEIRAPSPTTLMRIAWHLGNRHVPTQLCGETLLIRDDHVLAAMVEQLSGTASAITAPFDPEGGAYRGEAAHHHHDHHRRDHSTASHSHDDHDHG